MGTTKSVLMSALLLCSGQAFAQSAEKEPVAILEPRGSYRLESQGGRRELGSNCRGRSNTHNG